MTPAKIRAAMALMADRDNVARDVAEQLGVSLSTLYSYVDGQGRPKECARQLLEKKAVRKAGQMPTSAGVAR